MSKKLIYSASFVFVLGLVVCAANAAPYNQDPGSDGIVSIEAEHYDDNVERGGHKWELVIGPVDGFAGAAGMWAPNGRGGHDTNYGANSERLDYEINFVKTGPHYVWILAWGASGSDDSCHAGLDGVETPLSNRMSGWNNQYEWNNGRYERPEPSQIEITTTGVHVLNIYVREDGLIIDKIVLTTNPNYTLTGSEPGPPESIRGARVTAFNPSPGDGATDVPRDVALSWTAGAFADKHDVYLGTVLDNVNNADRVNSLGVLVSQGQGPNIYTPAQRLAFEETYYWRIDEVNAPPSSTIRKGSVWRFTTEPFVYVVTNVIATASSSALAKGPQNTVNRSGLDSTGLLHNTVGDNNMWLSDIAGPQPTWIQFEFDGLYKLHEMWVWNSNESLELAVGFGCKDVTIEYSINGTDYTTLGTTHQFARAPGASGYAHNTTVDLGGIAARYVRLTVNSNWGGILRQYGLSEVRFFYIPVYAREPNPDSGTTNVSIGTIDNPIDMTLGFRAGREAAKHNVYFSDSWQAVVNGTADVVSVTETSYGPLPLDLDKTYYWRVDEVNEVETPSIWQGDVWNFTTQEYFVVDDFESYNDLDIAEPGSNRIFNAWIDGYGTTTNGSIVGYDVPPFAERSIVHSDKQAMPFFYNNSGTAKYSEATLTLSPRQDWTKKGVKALSLWFRGRPGSVGSFVEGPVGKYTMTAAGADIWGTADQFHYAYVRLSGAGSIIARVESVELVPGSNDWVKAGVMIRETLEPGSKFAAVYMTPTRPDGTPTRGCRYQARVDTDGSATSDSSVATAEQQALKVPYWIKLERDVANNFRGYYSSDGATWQPMVWNPRNIVMGTDVYVGLALTSHSAGVKCEAKFSGVLITGAVTGQWQSQDIGILSNTADPMYVALANSGGTPAVVYHDNPNATQLNTWTEWLIALKQFSDKGVNLANINTIIVGIGDKNNPKPGGSGTLYFDDIRLYPSRCFLTRRSADFAKLDYVEDCVVNYSEFEVMSEQWLLEELTPGIGAGIWLEAESANTITAPMQVWTDRPDASGGQYIAVTPGNSSTGNPPALGRATYTFNVAAGIYKVVCRVIAPSGSDDSFWVRIPGATTQTINHSSGWVRWNGVEQGSDWHWDDVHSDDDPDDRIVHFTLAAGTHTLEIAYREDGTLLDRLLITDNLNLNPVTLSPMLADLNKDKKVDFKDYAILADAWLDEQLWPMP